MLDKDQEQPADVLTYHLKFRFYFQPYEPETETSPASHQNLIRLYFQTEAWAGEYDVPKVSSYFTFMTLQFRERIMKKDALLK